MAQLIVAVFCAQIGLVLNSPSVGEPFSLRVGEWADVEGTGFSLTFAQVTQDSRCPKDVLCVVAGEAVVVLVVTAGGEQTKLTFKVPPAGSDKQRVEDYRLTILKLEPEVESGKVIEPSSYIAQIVVDEIS